VLSEHDSTATLEHLNVVEDVAAAYISEACVAQFQSVDPATGAQRSMFCPAKQTASAPQV
jgi:hypothetical protein